MRWLTCPFPLVEHEVPPTGRILDFGTGHGLFAVYLASLSTRREVHGVDIDEDKLVVARAAAAGAPALDNVTFSSGLDLEGTGGDYDAIVIVDVLYLLEPSHQARLVADLAVRLSPGGRLVVKESAEGPRWKLRWSRAEELLATRVLRITKSTGTGLAFTSPTCLAEWMADAGLDVAQRAIDRGYPYPHHLVVGTAPFEPRVTGRATPG